MFSECVSCGWQQSWPRVDFHRGMLLLQDPTDTLVFGTYLTAARKIQTERRSLKKDKCDILFTKVIFNHNKMLET